MRLDNMQPDDEAIEDRRGQRGGFGFPRGGGMQFPMGAGGGFSIRTLIFLGIAYLIVKFFFGIDLLHLINGSGFDLPDNVQITRPDSRTDQRPIAPNNARSTGGNENSVSVDFVSRVLGSTRAVWTDIFKEMDKQYSRPKLVLFSGYVQSACGMAQSAMGPFYCPGDHKIYIDLNFYQDMKNKLGAPGDFAQAYVIAHEVGHHVQTELGITQKVQAARQQVSEEESNRLSVRTELQADCFAGIWAKQADAKAHILEEGDIEEALNAASQIGDDRLQKRSQGYAVPDSFTHGTSQQRVDWFKRGLKANGLRDCDSFSETGL